MSHTSQNPPGLYGGRKVLSRAFRNRFIELHIDDLPDEEIEVILEKRCELPPSYCKKLVVIMKVFNWMAHIHAQLATALTLFLIDSLRLFLYLLSQYLSASLVDIIIPHAHTIIRSCNVTDRARRCSRASTASSHCATCSAGPRANPTAIRSWPMRAICC